MEICVFPELAKSTAQPEAQIIKMLIVATANFITTQMGQVNDTVLIDRTRTTRRTGAFRILKAMIEKEEYVATIGLSLPGKRDAKIESPFAVWINSRHFRLLGYGPSEVSARLPLFDGFSNRTHFS